MGGFHLIVHNPFGSYQMGAHISDPTEVARVLAGPNARDVLRIAAVGGSGAAASGGTATGAKA